ncbi:MAG: helix-turn-helix domain-containing protein [Syntrophothermus sp.]|uniref:helix-turn-helix domain-containing protein n=1 Tax=Syntrophothermus sp. TaxID=2736299 RepID=UPI00257EA45E|nr:helix-turn-helix domain-containing protein [Syntrophothermus sp.]NSW84494.1 helix-turn-helix domain-containing protein [Syntrophothermus sp.]
MEEQIFLTVPEAAKILRLKRSTAYEYVRQGIIPSVRLGRFIRIRRDVVENLGFEKEIDGAGAKS